MPNTRTDPPTPARAIRNDLDQYLWSPERPNLVDAHVTLEPAQDPVKSPANAPGYSSTPRDEVASHLGLRAVGWEDGVFLLNHKPYFLRFALQQAYWPDSLLAASGEQLRREAELAKEKGLNGLRVHQKVEDPRFLYWADRLGLLLWEEMPSAYQFGPLPVERVIAEWTEAIQRDRSHPSIVAWVPLNESWSVPDPSRVPAQRHFIDSLYHLTKALAPSRPAVSNDGWEISAADIWGIHDYEQSSEVLRERYGHQSLREGKFTELWPNIKRVVLDGAEHKGQPMMLTEFGGMTFEPEQGAEWYGYDTVRTTEEFDTRLQAQIDAAVDSGLAGFCFTQFTDTEQETNGLLTEDREPKLPMERFRDILTTTRAQARARRED
ncbi:glycoside hydrolase family 2 TIM barrel-domain containing protein [Streptomyces sp. NPDC001661]